MRQRYRFYKKIYKLSLTFAIMQILPSDKINVTKWNQLVASEEIGPYDYSWYMESVSEKWYIYVDKEYTKGFAFSTTKRLGIENVTVAPFIRENNFYGNWSDQEINVAIERLKAQFSGGIFQTAKTITGKVRSYQIVKELALSKHARRNVNKAKKQEFIIREGRGIQPAYQIMVEELGNKIPDFNEDKHKILKNLFVELQSKNLLIIKEIVKHEEVMGGLFFFKGKNRDLYIKGGANEEGKKQGGMYLAMMEQIEETLSNGKLFDFDGSEVPGVKRFNEYFNTVDEVYYQTQWNNNPSWYKAIRKVYQVLKK